MIRLHCVECDTYCAAIGGGHGHRIGKSFDIDWPELEKWLTDHPSTRSVNCAEVIITKPEGPHE